MIINLDAVKEIESELKEVENKLEENIRWRDEGFVVEFEKIFSRLSHLSRS